MPYLNWLGCTLRGCLHQGLYTWLILEILDSKDPCLHAHAGSLMALFRFQGRSALGFSTHELLDLGGLFLTHALGRVQG